MRAVGLILLLAGLAGCGVLGSYRDTGQPIAAKADFVPERYVGLWYEVARYPVIFQTGCRGVTAEYGLREDGQISVLNICRRADGSERSRISGAAEIVGPGRLKVRFPSVPFGAGDYWVLWTDADYQTAVVGSPGGRAGWILHRAPVIAEQDLQQAKEALIANGYDPSRLVAMPLEDVE